MILGLPTPVLLMIVFAIVAAIGFLLLRNRNTNKPEIGLSLLTTACLGFLATTLYY